MSHDLKVCRRLLFRGSRSFYVASLLLPRKVRFDASAVYAFCRQVDDAVDKASKAELTSIMGTLKARVERLFDGSVLDNPVDRAFADVARRHCIPKAVVFALIDGMAWDAEGRRYEQLSELYGYSARVASAVGVMMTLVMGRRDADVLHRACDLGVAMQLTNIARDVGEDARMGRVYLPRGWFDELGINVDVWLSNPKFTPGIAKLTARLLGVADILYRRAEVGFAGLPPRVRPAMRAARLIYADIGREIARNGFDSVSQRAVVSLWQKLKLAWRARKILSFEQMQVSEPTVEEARFLVESVMLERLPLVSPKRHSPSSGILQHDTP